MKGLLAFAAIIGLAFAYTVGDRVYGGKVRDYFDKNERWLFPIAFTGFFAAMALLAMFLPVDKSELGFFVAYRALIVMGLNIVVGYAGLLDLGYIAFFAIGAYTMAIFNDVGPTVVPGSWNFWMIL